MNASQPSANDRKLSVSCAGASLSLYEKICWNEKVSAIADAHPNQVVVYDVNAPELYRLVSLNRPDVR